MMNPVFSVWLVLLSFSLNLVTPSLVSVKVGGLFANKSLEAEFARAVVITGEEINDAAGFHTDSITPVVFNANFNNSIWKVLETCEDISASNIQVIITDIVGEQLQVTSQCLDYYNILVISLQKGIMGKIDKKDSKELIFWLEFIQFKGWSDVTIIHDGDASIMMNMLINHGVNAITMDVGGDWKVVGGRGVIMLMVEDGEVVESIMKEALHNGIVSHGSVWLVYGGNYYLAVEGAVSMQMKFINLKNQVQTALMLVGGGGGFTTRKSDATMRSMTSSRDIEYIVYKQQDSTNVEIGSYSGNRKFHFNEDIVWPDSATAPPSGRKASELQIVTIEQRPFVHVVNTMEGGCPSTDTVMVPCKVPTNSKWETKCCYGICVDILIEITRSLNITYELHLVEDGKYGSYKLGAWNGLMGDLLSRNSDLILAPLSITKDRMKFVDFSKPFLYQGITILMRKKQVKSSLGSFLHPFNSTLWLSIGVAIHVVGVMLFLLDRFSPFGRYRPTIFDKEEDRLSLTAAICFSWGVLLNSGIGDGPPRSLSARVIGIAWACFAMVIVATYTANLAAFLVLDRSEHLVTDIHDPKLRDPLVGARYATVRDSAVESYLNEKVEFDSISKQVTRNSYENSSSAIEDLKLGKLEAFIWDSASLQYERSVNCDLVMAGEPTFGPGFGIAMRKKDILLDQISLLLLSFHENGFMDSLRLKWTLNQGCPQRTSSPATLKLENMVGVFILIGIGIISGAIFTAIEVVYKRKRN